MVILWLIIAAIGIHDLVSHESIPLHGCFHVYFNTFFPNVRVNLAFSVFCEFKIDSCPIGVSADSCPAGAP